jgi:hypothetical protein
MDSFPLQLVCLIVSLSKGNSFLNQLNKSSFLFVKKTGFVLTLSSKLIVFRTLTLNTQIFDHSKCLMFGFGVEGIQLFALKNQELKKIN